MLLQATELAASRGGGCSIGSGLKAGGGPEWTDAFQACTTRLLQDLLRLGKPAAVVAVCRVLSKLPHMPPFTGGASACHARAASLLGVSPACGPQDPQLLWHLLRGAGASRPLLDGLPLPATAAAARARLHLLRIDPDAGALPAIPVPDMAM